MDSAILGDNACIVVEACVHLRELAQRNHQGTCQQWQNGELAAFLAHKIVSWDLADTLPGLSDVHRFKVLFTAAPRGTIPATVWRAAHVIYTDEIS